MSKKGDCVLALQVSEHVADRTSVPQVLGSEPGLCLHPENERGPFSLVFHEIEMGN